MRIARHTRRAACALFLGLVFAGAAHAQKFERIAGGALGDGGQATNAFLNGASDIAFDAAGVAYVTQAEGNRIRRIATDGTITTLVGGKRGFSGDGGPASAAAIDGPRGLVIDAAGNVYFNDSGNRRVRRIAPDGTITTVAGNGTAAYSGDGGQATAAGFVSLAGLGLGPDGSLYIADPLNHRIRKVMPSGTITTFAGIGSPGYEGVNSAGEWPLNGPQGVAVDANGKVYIADTQNAAIVAVSPEGVRIGVRQDHWTPTPGKPARVAIGPNGTDVWFSEDSRCQLWKWEGGIDSGTWPSLPWSGTEGYCFYSGDGQARDTVMLNQITGIAFDAAGNVTFVDANTSQVRQFVADGEDWVTRTFAGRNGEIADNGIAIGAPMSLGAAIAIEEDGDVVVAEADDNRRIRRITPAGRVFAVAGSGKRWTWGGCDNSSCDAREMAFEQVRGLAVGAAGGLFFTDATTAVLYEVRSDNLVYPVTTRPMYYEPGLDGTSIGEGQAFAYLAPGGVARDAAGNLFIADEGHHRVRKIGTNGINNTIAGTGVASFSGDNGLATSAKINAPKAIALDAAGNVYFSDSGNRRIRRITPLGAITTIAGNGKPGVTGDGGAATSAAIGIVHGLVMGANGVLWFSSEGRLRYLSNGIVQSVEFPYAARALAYRNGYLVVSTEEGMVFRANLIRRPHDYDADGRADILWRNSTTGANTIWKGASNATQQAVTTVTGTAWKIVGQGDFDGDMRSDIVWRNVQTGANAIWKSGISTTQINVTGVTNLAWSIVGVGDFNRDGKSDLLWRNGTTGQNTLWRSANATTQSTMATAGVQWKVAGVADFDGDGIVDVLWRNTTTGANAIWRSGVSTTAMAVASAAVEWKIQGVGDFDGDGRADIFWRNSANGQNGIWNAANNKSIRTLATVGAQTWKVFAVGDYDGDGRADILWRNTTSGANLYWRAGDSAQAQSLVGVTGTAWTIVPSEFQP